MKKKEIKEAFENEFSKIKVSDELKVKTLNSVKKSSASKVYYLRYLRNFAAIFAVTLICISVYFTRNFSQKESENFVPLESEWIESDFYENSSSLNTASPILKSTTKRESLKSLDGETTYRKEISVYDYSGIESVTMNSISDSKIYIAGESVEEKQSTLSEDEFLIKYPEAEKQENGYIVYENGKKNLYIFSNKVLEKVETIE